VICDTCGLKPAEPGRDECFRCRVISVGFGWRGGGYNFGRHNFHDRTNAEFVNEHVGEVRGNPNIERADPL
jgi:hypothetical protein